MLSSFKGLLCMLVLPKTEERKGESLFLCIGMENVYRLIDFMLEKQALDWMRGQAGKICRGEKYQCNRKEQADFWHRALKYRVGQRMENSTFRSILSCILIEILLCGCAGF